MSRDCATRDWVDSRHFRIDYRWATNDPEAADAQRGRAAVSGLTSYGVDVDDMCRGRLLILEREKPADLLVQAPNKYALALNLKWGRRCLVQRYSAPRSTWNWIGQ